MGARLINGRDGAHWSSIGGYIRGRQTVRERMQETGARLDVSAHSGPEVAARKRSRLSIKEFSRRQFPLAAAIGP